jgi:uncharacterized protein YndB with AHSA1/START domain
MDTVEEWIDAPPERVWPLVADVGRYGEWSPENRGGRWQGPPGVGAVFKGTNRHGVMRWTTRCTVLEYEQPSRFSFEVADSRMRWGYRLEPERGGTRVVEWREHVGQVPLFLRLFLATGVLGRQRERLLVDGMRRTLAAMKAAAERA